MKNIIILFLLGTIVINAQVIDKQEKSFNLSKNQDLFVNFKFAKNIEIKQWNKNEVVVKATYSIDDGEGNKDFTIETDNNTSELKIYSDFGDYYDKRNYQQNCNHSQTNINYTLYLPKNIDLTVKSISGSVEILEFTGNLTTDLISGDVTIKKYKGKLQLKTISGDLDVIITKAKIKAKTLTGTIYSDLEIIMDENKPTHSGHTKITGVVNNGKNLVNFYTISGNVYMRKL